jgi:hypothetical protein
VNSPSTGTLEIAQASFDLQPNPEKKMKNLNVILAAIGSLSIAALMPTKAQIIITEVDPAGSGTSAYAADWFELTNYGSSAVTVNNWSIDDNSNSFSNAVPITGLTSIGAGQSVVLVEDTGTTAAAVNSKFEAAWFGSNVPAGFTIGNYGGSGVGLGQSGDAVNVFDSAGDLIAGVQFGSSSTTTGTFDNSMLKLTASGSAGATVADSDPTLTTFSKVGVNGAFNSLTSGEIGSPGAVPEPSSGALAGVVAAALAGCLWRRRTLQA